MSKTAASSRLLVIATMSLLTIGSYMLGTPTALHAAQTTGTVSGSIHRSDGTAVSGATVTLTNTAGGSSSATALTTKTTSDGAYVFVGVQPGSYTLNVTAGGYEPLSSPVVVQQDFTSTVDFTLEPRRVGGVTRIIPNQVRRTDPTNSYVVSAKTEQETKSQPNNLYQFPGLVFGQPGITYDPSGYTHIRGADFNQVGFDVDGVQVTEPMTNSFATNIVTVGLKSANLYTGAADASYGNATGGFINEVTANGKDFALGNKKVGGVIEGTFGPGHGWDYTGTNSQIGGITPNGKLDFYASTILFNNKFPNNTQISKLTGSADGVLKLNYYADRNNTLTGFISQGTEAYNYYQPYDPTQTLHYVESKAATEDLGSFQQDHDTQGYSFDYLTYKHNFDPKSFFSYRFYRLKNWVTFQLTNLASEFEERHSTTTGNQLDYQNNFSPQDTFRAGLYYIPSTTYFHVITGATNDWRTRSATNRGYNDRSSQVKPHETDEYLQNTLSTRDQKITLDTGLRLGQDTFDRMQASKLTDSYADPRLGLAYSPTRDFKLRSSFAVESEFPDSRLVEFLAPELTGNVPVTANSPAAQLAYFKSHYQYENNLKPLHSQNYDLGFDKGIAIGNSFLQGSYLTTMSIFRRVGYDQIQANYQDYTGLASPYPITYNNAGHAHSSGVEFQLSKRVVRPSDWNGFVSYTNQVTNANNTDFDTGYLPYFGDYLYGDYLLSGEQFANLNNREFPTSYDQRHTVAVVVDKRISKLFEMAAFLDAGSGFPFTGGNYAGGNFGATSGAQFSENAVGNANFNEIPTLLPGTNTLQALNPVVGRSGWHYKITLNTNFYLTPSTSLFFNVDNVFDKKTVVNYATTTQAGSPYYTAPSAAYPEGRLTYGPSTILTPIFVTFGFRNRF